MKLTVEQAQHQLDKTHLVAAEQMINGEKVKLIQTKVATGPDHYILLKKLDGKEVTLPAATLAAGVELFNFMSFFAA